MIKTIPPPSPTSSLQFKLLGALSLGLLVILIAALAGLGSAWRNLSAEEPPEIARRVQAGELQRGFRLQVQEWKDVLIRGSDDELRKHHIAAFHEEGRKVAELARDMSASRDVQTRELAKKFLTEHQHLEERFGAAMNSFAANDYDPVQGDVSVRGIDRSVAATADALWQRADERAKLEATARSEGSRDALVTSASVTAVAAIVLMVVLAIWLRRAVIAPVVAVEAAARAVARGELHHIAPPVTGRDEIARLGRAMAEVTQTLRDVLSAQATMAQRHEAGEISYRMDHAAFPGGYGEMVRDCNSLVNAHIEVKLRAIEVMGRYAIGDLSPDMERLPGEKAIITRALDTAKANLGAINAEIKALAAAAAVGDFSQRGDEAAYQHDFRDMVGGLNCLMQTTERDLVQVSSVLQAIARGDLTARMEGEFHGVFARMRDDVVLTCNQLTGMVGGIKRAAQSIQTAAVEIAAGNNDLSQRTERQAANLEETAASMEELTSTVRQNADHAIQASGLAAGAQKVASQGGEVVGQVVHTMIAIEASSKRISEIISVIDSIAFQTNILALNAAVEAARAGAEGRGFAVVASEIRTLAQRSTVAAKDIKELIEASVTDVSAGSRLVREAGETMGEIVAGVQRVSAIMAEISSASNEQSAGIEQVNQTVAHMDETTQQNAALVEEASAAARSMEQQAIALNEAVDVFKLTPAANDAEQATRPLVFA